MSHRVNAAVSGARRALGWADAQVQHLRDSLTPGQRWTAALALTLAIAVLRFGTPTVTRTLVAPATRAAPPAAAPAPADNVSDDGAATATAPRPPAASPATAAPLAPEPPVDDRVDGPVPSPAAPPEVVAFVATGGDALPGRDDRAMAEAFLANARFAATVAEYDPESEELSALCADHGGADVVVAGLGLPPGLRDCLAAAGARVVSYDERTRPSAALVSTRRPVAQVLVDLARWGRDEGALRGTVGLAVSEDLRGQVAAALPAMQRAGVDPVVHYVADAGGVGEGVQAFRSASVETTVFALPAVRQREWVTLDRLVNRDVDYVVADAAGGIVNGDGGHAPVFDGARAYTSLLFPWHEETEVQEECRSQWEDAGGRLAGTAELFRAYTWCQHVALVGDVLGVVREAGAPLATAFSTVELTSPLTTRLGAFEDGGWGPRIDHVLTWRADCGCWAEAVPVADRGG